MGNEGFKGSKEKEDPTRRDVIKAAVGVGAALGGVVEGITDVSWEGVRTPKEKIEDYRTNPESGFDNDAKFHEFARTPVVGYPDFGRAPYVHAAFNTFIPEEMSPEVHAFLIAVASGVPAQETRYDNDRVSPVGAEHLWQLTKGGIKDVNRYLSRDITLEDTARLSVGTKAAFIYFDRIIYPKIAGPAETCAKHFKLIGDDEIAKFQTLVMINAYNAGPTRMERVLNAFRERFSADDIHEFYDHSALSLFNAMAERTVRDGYEPRYGVQASQYVFQVLAGAESLNAEYILKNGVTLPESLKRLGLQAVDFLKEEVAEPGAAGLVGGSVGYASVKLHNAVRGKTVPKQGVGGKDYTRRAFIAGSLASIGTGVASSQIVKELPAIDFLWWRK